MVLRILLAIVLFCCCRILTAGELKMAAIGTSTTQATDVITISLINPRYSWATGDLIDSHKIKLERERGVEVIAKNVAIPGATSEFLWLEVDLLGDFIPDYTTVEIGANDVCQGRTVETLKHVKRLLDRLVKLNPNMEIILVAIPRITSIRDARDTLECQAIWNITCSPLLGALVTREQREIRQLKLDGLNYGLLKLAKNYPQVRFNMVIGETPISDEDLSAADCFHPSVEGQQHIADVTFVN